jgi:hypothetical protein
VIHNILILPKASDEAIKLKTWSNIATRIAKSSLSYKTRKAAIKKHKQTVAKIITLFRDKLLSVTEQLQ